MKSLQKTKNILLFSLVALVVSSLFFLVSNANAYTKNGTEYTTNGSSADVQAAVNDASNGDTVNIPSGNFTWGSPVAWSNKAIVVSGAGAGITNITGSGFSVTSTTEAGFRICNMSIDLVGTTAINIFHDSQTPTGGTYSKGWRVDHLNITANNTSSNRTIFVTGLTYGVIDHVTWSADYAYAQFFTVYAKINSDPWQTEDYGEGKRSWDLVHSLGDQNAIYIENCTLTGSANGSWAGDVVYGGEVVYRYNDIEKCQISTHSTRYGARGGKRIEAYNNKFIAEGMTDQRVVWWRSGTGVVFNNTLDSTASIMMDNQRSCLAVPDMCTGSNANDGNVLGEHGWPCLDQPGTYYGAPQNQTLEPIYSWNNGLQEDCRTTQATCSATKHLGEFGLCSDLTTYHLKTVGGTHPGSIVDYVNNGTTAKPGYSPLAYPHPLRRQFRSDFDVDDDVDIFDYNILLGNFGTIGDCENPADADGDCNVNIFDYNILLGEFGSGA